MVFFISTFGIMINIFSFYFDEKIIFPFPVYYLL